MPIRDPHHLARSSRCLTTPLLCSLLAAPLLGGCGDDGRADSMTATGTGTATITATATDTGSATDTSPPITSATDVTVTGTATDSQGSDTASTPSTATDATGDTGTATDPTAATITTMSTDSGDTTTGVPPTLHCSADLKKVLDEQNQVVETCIPEEGCFDGKCIPACEAASSIQGTIGCDFWAPTPPFVFNGNPNTAQNGPCFAVFLANTWDKPAKITIERGGMSYDASTFARVPKGIAPNTVYEPLPPEGLPPDGVAILFLSHRPGTANGSTLECPFPPAVLEDTAVSGAGKGLAFRVATDVPVRAYDILPYGGASSFLPSATLLFPSPSWGTNFVAAAPELGDYGDGRFALVVANEDNTTIKVGPKSDFPGGGAIVPAPAGQITEYILNAGESIQWSGQNNPMDPTSAVFESDKPIGLWTGNKYMKIDSATSPGGGGGDSSHQQIPHVKALGSEYVGAGIVTRLLSMEPESIPYRIVGAVDGTALTWDPKPAGVPDMIGAGEIVDFETTQIFVVRAQDDEHPFLFTQYMPGTQGNFRPGCTGSGESPCGLGDEEWVNLLAPQQFQSRYVFFTDPTYPTTNVVLIRVKGEDDTFSDVTIECLGTVQGWQPAGSEGKFEYAHVELSRGGVAAPGTTCDTSRHLASSSYTFGIVVWGTDSYSSYGYPGGGDVGTINDVFVPIPQ